jgi:hypothetical protein
MLNFSNLTRKKISWNILLEFFGEIIGDASTKNLSHLPPLFWRNHRQCLPQQFILLPPVLVPMGGEGLVEWGEVAMAMPTLLALAHVYQMS